MAEAVLARVPASEDCERLTALANEMLAVGRIIAEQTREPGDSAAVDASSAVVQCLNVLIQEARRADIPVWSVRTALVGSVAYFASIASSDSQAMCLEIGARAARAVGSVEADHAGGANG